jgi:predicted transcriptional regulator
MVDSISEQLEREMACEELLSCFYGHTELDKACLRVLGSSGEPLTVDDVAERVDCDRSTVYRSIQRLLTTGFVEKEQVNYDAGGYYHRYTVADPEGAAKDMRAILNDWHSSTKQLIGEFEEKYDETEPRAVENWPR